LTIYEAAIKRVKKRHDSSGDKPSCQYLITITTQDELGFEGLLSDCKYIYHTRHKVAENNRQAVKIAVMEVT
jgi:beta-glucosidase